VVVKFVLALGLVALVAWSFVELGGGCCTLRQGFCYGSLCGYVVNFTSCQSFGNYTPYAEVKVADGAVLVSGRVVPNCCSEVLKAVVSESGGVLFIYLLEADLDGVLCKCVCPRDFNLSTTWSGRETSVLWVVFHGGALARAEILYTTFCGVSTYGECKSDADCVRDGCSGEVCRSVFEEATPTACVWRECFDAGRYRLKCGCVNGRCQWTYAG